MVAFAIEHKVLISTSGIIIIIIIGSIITKDYNY